MSRGGILAVLALWAVLAAGVAHGEDRQGGGGVRPDPCSATHAGGGENFGFPVDGLARVAHLHVPIAGAAAGRRLPLLIALHGSGGSGSGMEAFTGFSALADRQGFLAVYPDAHGALWAIHDGTARGDMDIEFIKRMISDLEERFCVDPGRVFVVGVSNGGGEAARLACSLSDQLAGVALVAGQYGNQPRCAPRRAVSVFEIHAQTDEVAPYRHGSGSVPQFLAFWRAIDHCALPGSHRRLDSQTVAAEWSCAAGTRVSQLRLAHGGHFWPGATAHSELPAPGSAAARIWDFFRALP